MPKLSLKPLNRFLRNPNQHSFDKGTHFTRNENKLMNQVKLLKDPKNNREMLLIGTLNSSSILANRTAKMIEEFDPDSVLVQTTSYWYDGIKSELLDEPRSNRDVFKHSAKYSTIEPNVSNNFRGLVFKSRYHSWRWCMKHMLSVPCTNSSPFVPGLEVYKAIDYAVKHKKPINYAGPMFSSYVIAALIQEKRMDVLFLIYRYITALNNSFWKKEAKVISDLMAVHSFAGFCEIVDDNIICWLIAYVEKLAPYQKRIIFDMVSEDIFRKTYKEMPGDKIFALVNQWHMPMVEHLWREKAGTVEKKEFINPIGDFDINSVMEGEIVNDYLRRLRAKNSRSEPSTTGSYITHYHKTATEAERERHAFFTGYDDPELEHSLFNGENDGVQGMPYKVEKH